MKTFIKILTLVALFSVANAQPSVDTTEFTAGKYHYVLISEMLNGVVHGKRVTYVNGRLDAIHTYRVGELDGPFERYWHKPPYGIVTSGHFLNNKAHGKVLWYSLEGDEVRVVGEYKHGKEIVPEKEKSTYP